MYKNNHMNSIVPLNEVSDIEKVATDLRSQLISDADPAISVQFPGLFQAYSISLDSAVNTLEADKSQCEKGVHEQFIIYAGSRAVGMSVVTLKIPSPKEIENTSPNLSSFICSDYRGQGLGRLSLSARMEIVRNNFNDHAWTLIKDGNAISEHLITDAGFNKIRTNYDNSGQNLYTYKGKIKPTN